MVKIHPTDIKVYFADLLAFDLPVLRRVVNFGENFQEKYTDVKYRNSFNGERGKGKEYVNNKGKEEILTHVEVRYRHLTDHRHPSPDTLHSPLLKILTEYFANSSRVS